MFSTLFNNLTIISGDFSHFCKYRFSKSSAADLLYVVKGYRHIVVMKMRILAFNAMFLTLVHFVFRADYSRVSDEVVVD